MGAKPTSLYGARVSADRTRIAYSEYHVAKDIWVFDTVRGTTDRQTYEGQNMFPTWRRMTRASHFGRIVPDRSACSSPRA